MISNTTPSGATTNIVNSEQLSTLFFGPASQHQLSQQFTVDQQPFFLAAFNLATGDSITVQQVFGLGAETLTANFAPVFGPVVLNVNRTKCRIDYPGRYQLLHSGPSPLGTFSVVGAAGTMTHEAFSDLAEAFYSTNSNLLPVSIIGTSPVVVTGNGTVSTPYDVTTPDIVVVPSGLFGISIGHGATSTPGTSSTLVGGGIQDANVSEIVIGANASTTTNAATHTNVIVGNGAGWTSNTITGTSNILFSGVYSTTGTYANNVNIGNGGSANNAFSNTVCIGVGAGNYSLPTGGTAIGCFAGNNTVNLGACLLAGYNAGANALGGGNMTALGYSAGLNSTATGVFIGAYAGDGNTHINSVVVNNASGTALNTTQDNQILLGGSTNTQLVTAGSIIQAGAISASDERLKKDIIDEQGALETVERLEPVAFKWDRGAVLHSKIPMNEDEYGKQQHGLLAQDVEVILPEIIENIDRGNGPYKFVRYERIIPILIAAIKELSAEVKELKAKGNSNDF